MLADRRFQFRLVLTIFTALGLVVLIALGAWQMQRLSWKQGLIAKIEARIDAAPISFEEAVARAEAGEDMEYTPVSLIGRFVDGADANVFGSYEGKAGVYVFTPLQSEQGAYIYINRGFTPQGVSEAMTPPMLTPERSSPIEAGGQVEAAGLFRSREEAFPPAAWFRPTTKSADGLWFMRDPLLFGADAGIETVPYYVDRFAVEGAQWPKGGTTRIDFRNKHRDYALTWFGLAGALFGVWLVFSLPKR